MRTLFRLGLIVVLLVLSARMLSATWHQGIVHCHSTFSDGLEPPSVVKAYAKSNGAEFLIMTDHIEQIASEKKLAGKYTDDFGFAKYLADFSGTEPLLCIAGAEITNAGPHILVLEHIGALVDVDMPDNQKEVLKWLKKLNLKSVAAHPNLYNDEERIFRFGEEPSPDGVEFFNESAKKYERTLSSYLNLVKEGKNVFATAGCDSHSVADPSTLWRWSKRTWVWTDGELDEKTLGAAFSHGHTYAGYYGAFFKGLNHLPGFTAKAVERAQFVLVVGFAKGPTTSEKQIRIYRDGQLIEGSVQRLAPGQSEYQYNWEDAGVSSGEHNYVIEVSGCLVTSPLRLKVGVSDQLSGYDDWSAQPVSTSLIGEGGVIGDAFMGKGRALAFLSDRDGRIALYLADTKEKKMKRVINLDGFVAQFNLSPSGERILLIDKSNQAYALLLRPTGPYRQESQFPKLLKLNLTVQLGIFPSWDSEDGFHFVSPTGQVRHAKISLREEDLVKQLLPSAKNFLEKLGIRTESVNVSVEVEEPDPERSFLTTQKDSAGYWQICVIDSNGKVTKWLTSGRFDCAEPEVGRVGMLMPIGMNGPVVCTTTKDGNQDIALLSPSEGKATLRRLTTNLSEDSQPQWAYYTSKVYFTSKRQGCRRIWEMKNDGTEQKMMELNYPYIDN